MPCYRIRTATPDDLDAARGVMLDTVYRDFGTGYVPRRHADIIDPAAAYLTGARHTLLVAVDGGDGAVVATAALDPGPGPSAQPAMAGRALSVGRDRPAAPGDGGYNLARVCDKAVDRAVAEAGSRADDAARHRAALAAQTAVLRTDGAVPLVHQRILHGVGASVRGVLLDPYERTLVGTGTRR